MLQKWEDLPDFMRTPEVRPYYNNLDRKRWSLRLKKVFDISVAGIIICFFCIPMILIGIAIKLDSSGPVFFRQERVTTYGKPFLIYKFRTMVFDIEKAGIGVTLQEDPRITRLGKILRKYRIDEVPQLINIIRGEMSFVGTRPELPLFVRQYTPEMMATLLLPAGVTSKASIKYKDEATLFDKAVCAEEIYIKKVLPEKMKINLEAIKEFSLLGELEIMGKTVWAVIGKVAENR
ncbi:MAG: sugar transferase [Lachnospiraceae bacterium]|nr:sugar transferase [Lachnospiraceae bacterium]